MSNLKLVLMKTLIKRASRFLMVAGMILAYGVFTESNAQITILNTNVCPIYVEAVEGPPPPMCFPVCLSPGPGAGVYIAVPPGGFIVLPPCGPLGSVWQSVNYVSPLFPGIVGVLPSAAGLACGIAPVVFDPCGGAALPVWTGPALVTF